MPRGSFLSGAAGKAEGSYLELFDLERDGLDISAALQVLKPFQVLLRLPQPGQHAVQVRVKLLPPLGILFRPQLLAQGLRLEELPAVNHTWQDSTRTGWGGIVLHSERSGNV